MTPLTLLETPGKLWVVQKMLDSHEIESVESGEVYYDYKTPGGNRIHGCSHIGQVLDVGVDHPPSTEVEAGICNHCGRFQAKAVSCYRCSSRAVARRKITLPPADKWQILLATDFSTEHFEIPVDTDTYPHLDSYHRLIELTDGGGEVQPGVWVAVVEVTIIVSRDLKQKATK